MRIVILAAAFTLPFAAAAQTPADMARQLWPLGAPATVSVAPLEPSAPGAFTPGTLARLSSLTASRSVSTAPRQPASAGAFTARDLARQIALPDPLIVHPANTAYASAGPD